MKDKLPPVKDRAWLTEGELARRLGFQSKDWFSRLRRANPEMYPPVATHLNKRPLKFLKADIEKFESRGLDHDRSDSE